MGKNLIIKGTDFSNCGLGNAFNYLINQGDLDIYTVKTVPGVSPFSFINLSSLIGKTITALQLKFESTGIFTCGKVTEFGTNNVLSEQKFVIYKTGIQIVTLREPITIESETDNIFFSTKEDSARFYYGTNNYADAVGFYISEGGIFNKTNSNNRALGVNLIGE